MKKTFLFAVCSFLLIGASFAMNPQFRRYLDLRGLSPSRLTPYSGYIYEYPHSSTYDIGCESCHYQYNPGLPPDWATFNPQTIDDTLYNALCWNCHNDITAPYVKTHSSLTNDNTYGTWTVECKTCHEPHVQAEKTAYGSDSYVYQGSVTSVSDNLVQSTGAGWTDNQYQGYVVTPNVADWLYYSYKITRNSSDTLSVEGPMDLSKAPVGSTFAITDTKLVQDTIATPSSGSRGVKFYRSTGANSGSDGDSTYDGVCEVCHTATSYFRNSGSGYATHMLGRRCTQCHKHVDGFKFSGGRAHFTHQNLLTCTDGNLGCHGVAEPPLLADNLTLASTTKCNNCHNASNVSTAKSYWDNAGTVGSWSTVAGEVTYCGSCHNPTTPGNSQMNGGGDTAQDVMGNNSTYGYRVTGHGKTSGNYPRMAWQATTASGNPAANQVCSGCHDLTSQHYNNAGKRLKSGFANDNNNSNCTQCHNPGTSAVAAPHMYSTYAAYQASAHAAYKCTDCHDVHGKVGAYAAMTKGNKQALCLQTGCHVGMSGHALDVSFARGGSSYSLQCVSCHNVHIVTGRISAADNTITPLTRIDNNLVLWGGAAGQKMNDFAGSGVYRTPTGDTLTGAQLPDYPTFCLQCHGQDMTPSIHGNISWGEMHGTGTAGVPSGGGSCPNWFGCGYARGWDGDTCTAGDNCFPVIPRGAGEQIWSRDSYTMQERVRGANFVLSCNDCHVTHEGGVGRKLRSTINGAPGSTNYGTLCNACHWYYSDWHAGMSCGNAGCHNAGCANSRGTAFCDYNTIHGQSRGGGGGSKTFDNTLVGWFKFENNLNDSGDWRMHGRWSVTTGSYAAGRVGTAAVFADSPVEIGTTNGYWSTDAGYHNTWTASEMKFNMTVEAWVYPTDGNGNERRIMAKSWYYDGGYALMLRKVNGAWRAGLLTNNTGVRNDYRGAYSTTSVPLNQWTHVAATYDWTGPNRNPADGSVGRIRIYVNGEDVTTSDASGSYMQPGAGEPTIYPYSAHDAAPVGICYNDSWCAQPLSIGGVNWSDNAANFIGRIDEVKIWNITKSPSYFDTIDAMTIPRIDRVDGVIGNDNLVVTFSEGVYTNTGGVGALVPADFVLTDYDNHRTIVGVTHTAGASTAVVRLSSVLDSSNDINVDTLAAAANAIFDDHDNPADTTAVVISPSSTCPTGQVVFNLNEASGSSYVLDNSGLLYGVVNDPSNTMGGGTFYGDNINNYISFQNNTSCMKATTNLTLEARIKPTSMAGTGNYLARVFAKDTSNNYQMTVWRNNTTFAPNFNAPSGTASIAFWVNVENTHGGNTWKPVLTNYTACPVVSDHWYQVKVVWDTNLAGGVPDQPFVPANIYIQDQGTDGNGAGRSWVGYNDCTKADQSYQPAASKLYTGDKIVAADSIFAIGCAAGTLGNNKFIGWIDWIKWYGYAGAPPSGPAYEQPDYEMDLFTSPPGR